MDIEDIILDKLEGKIATDRTIQNADVKLLCRLIQQIKADSTLRDETPTLYGKVKGAESTGIRIGFSGRQDQPIFIHLVNANKPEVIFWGLSLTIDAAKHVDRALQAVIKEALGGKYA